MAGAEILHEIPVRLGLTLRRGTDNNLAHVNIGRHCRIRNAIIDRDVHIPEGTIIGYDRELDGKDYLVTETGITVVTRDYSLFESPIAVDYFTSE